MVFLAGFLYFGMQPQTVEANSSLILEAPTISLTSPIRVIELNDDYTLTSPDRITGLYKAAENLIKTAKEKIGKKEDEKKDE